MRWNSNQWVSVLVANHVDPSSGMKGNILRALAQYRRERGKINFGTFFTGNPNAPEGKVLLEEGSRVRSASLQIHQ